MEAEILILFIRIRCKMLNFSALLLSLNVLGLNLLLHFAAFWSK